MHHKGGQKGQCWCEHDLGQGAAHRSRRNGICLLNKVFTMGCLPGSCVSMLAQPGELLLCPDRGTCLPLSSFDPSDQISSSSLGTQFTSGSRTLMCFNPDILGGKHHLSAVSAPSESCLPPLAEKGAAVTNLLLLARNDAGRKALLPQRSSKRP